MIILKTNPKTPGTRHKKYLYSITNTNFKKKWQTVLKKRKSGRDSKNGILLFKRKSPQLKKYINICEKTYMFNKQAILLNFLHYFKNRTTIGVVKFTNGAYANIRTAHGLLPGSVIKTANYPAYFYKSFNLGDTILLHWLEPKITFFNIINITTKEAVYTKAAGTFSVFVYLNKEKNYSKIKLPSGDYKFFYNYTFVTLGRNSNVYSKYRVIGKAGDNVKIGLRPSVRGIAMNPVDHPHGGRAKTNSPERTPWGKIAKKNK